MSDGVTLNKLLNFTKPWSLLLVNGDSNYPYFTDSLWILKKRRLSAQRPKRTLLLFFMLCFFCWRIIIYSVRNGPTAGPSEAEEGDPSPEAGCLRDPQAPLLSQEVEIFLTDLPVTLSEAVWHG